MNMSPITISQGNCRPQIFKYVLLKLPRIIFSACACQIVKVILKLQFHNRCYSLTLAGLTSILFKKNMIKRNNICT